MSEKWVSALFSKLQVRYLHKWTSALPTAELIRLAVSEWSLKLAGVTGEQVKHGLDTWDAEWPPSASEFRKACLGNVSRAHVGLAYKPWGGLPKSQRDKSIGDGVLAECSKVLKVR